MTNTIRPARRIRRALVLAGAFALPATTFAQKAQRYSSMEAAPRQQGAPVELSAAAEPLVGIHLGMERHALASYLAPRGWRLVADSLEDVGEPSLFAGKIDGHTAEIVAMYAPHERGGRLENLLVNLPVRDAAELRATYAWAFRRMQAQRCSAALSDDYRAQLDSLLGGRAVAVPAHDDVPTQPPMLRGHTTVESGNMDWPEAVWPTSDGALGTRLFASVLDPASPWPYQVTLWTSALYSGTCVR